MVRSNSRGQSTIELVIAALVLSGIFQAVIALPPLFKRTLPVVQLSQEMKP